MRVRQRHVSSLLLLFLLLGVLIVLLVRSDEPPERPLTVLAQANEAMNDQAPSPEPERVSVPVPSASDPVEALAEPETDSTEVGSIKGSLFDDKGQRLPYKRLTFRRLDQPARDWRSIKNLHTDARGDYRLKNLPAGRSRASDRRDSWCRAPMIYTRTANPARIALKENGQVPNSERVFLYHECGCSAKPTVSVVGGDFSNGRCTGGRA